MAGRRGLSLPLRRFAEVSERVPVMVDVAPIGSRLMPDLAAAGGVPAVLAALGSELDLSVPMVAETPEQLAFVEPVIGRS